MKFDKWVLIVGLFPLASAAATPNFYSAFIHIPNSVTMTHLSFTNKALQAQMMAGMKSAIEKRNQKEADAKRKMKHGTITITEPIFVLPQLYVFNTKSREVFASKADSRGLIDRLSKAISNNVPLSNGLNIATVLNGVIPDGVSAPLRPRTKNQVTFVEYWAPWCTSCFSERDQLLSYVRKHPDIKINWVTVKADYINGG